MKFCTNCGSQVQDGAICACQQVAATQQPVQPQVATPQSVPQQQVYAPTANTSGGNLISNAMVVIKSFFSKQPLDATVKAANDDQHVWVVLLGVSVLLLAIADRFVTGAFFEALFTPMVGTWGGPSQSELSELVSDVQGWAFMYGIVNALVSFALATGSIAIVYAMAKVQFSFVKLVNLVSSSLLMSALFAAVVVVLSFVNIWGTYAVMLAMPVFSTAFLSYAVKKDVRDEVSGFWIVPALLLAMLVSVPIANALAPDMTIMGENVGNPFEMFQPIFQNMFSMFM